MANYRKSSQLPVGEEYTDEPVGSIVQNVPDTQDETPEDYLAPLVLVGLEPQKIHITIDGEEYVIKEASEGAATQWRNVLMKSTRFGPDGKPDHIDGMADAEPFLVSRCLFKVTKQGLIPLAINTILQWPARIVKPIYDRIMKISNLEEKADKKESKDELKNSPDTTTEPSA